MKPVPGIKCIVEACTWVAIYSGERNKELKGFSNTPPTGDRRQAKEDTDGSGIRTRAIADW